MNILRMSDLNQDPLPKNYRFVRLLLAPPWRTLKRGLLLQIT